MVMQTRSKSKAGAVHGLGKVQKQKKPSPKRPTSSRAQATPRKPKKPSPKRPTSSRAQATPRKPRKPSPNRPTSSRAQATPRKPKKTPPAPTSPLPYIKIKKSKINRGAISKINEVKRSLADDKCCCPKSGRCRTRCLPQKSYPIDCECDSTCLCGNSCPNKRIQNCKYAEMELFDAGEKGRGVKAVKVIQKGEFIIDYVGEIITHKLRDERDVKYMRDENKHVYFFDLGHRLTVDATKYGNLSRFINHSCDPNAVVYKINVNKQTCLGIYAERKINANEEITIDYTFETGTGQECKCGADNCSGYVGGKK